MKAVPKDSTLYAAKLIDQLRELDATVHGAYFDMGRILSSIAHGKLYDTLGYDSLAHLIEEELSFSSSQGYRYLHTYRHFKQLGYNKTESLDLINEFSFSHMTRYLPTAKVKVGKRAVKNAIEKQLEESKQINVQLNGSDLRMLVAVLKEHGAEESDTGRLMHSSEALMSLARSARKQPALKAV